MSAAHGPESSDSELLASESLDSELPPARVHVMNGFRERFDGNVTGKKRAHIVVGLWFWRMEHITGCSRLSGEYGGLRYLPQKIICLCVKHTRKDVAHI